MKIKMDKYGAAVTREKVDPKYYNDSQLWHAIRNALIAKGHDVIKRLMWKDGHMVSDTQHYVRDRGSAWCLHFSAYALRYMYEDFNEGSLYLQRGW